MILRSTLRQYFSINTGATTSCAKGCLASSCLAYINERTIKNTTYVIWTRMALVEHLHKRSPALYFPMILDHCLTSHDPEAVPSLYNPQSTMHFTSRIHKKSLHTAHIHINDDFASIRLWATLLSRDGVKDIKYGMQPKIGASTNPKRGRLEATSRQCRLEQQLGRGDDRWVDGSYGRRDSCQGRIDHCS